MDFVSTLHRCLASSDYNLFEATKDAPRASAVEAGDITASLSKNFWAKLVNLVKLGWIWAKFGQN